VSSKLDRRDPARLAAVTGRSRAGRSGSRQESSCGIISQAASCVMAPRRSTSVANRCGWP